MKIPEKIFMPVLAILAIGIATYALFYEVTPLMVLVACLSSLVLVLHSVIPKKRRLEQE